MSNFTPAQTATMLENAPIDLEIAKQLAADFGMSHREGLKNATMLALKKLLASTLTLEELA